MFIILSKNWCCYSVRKKINILFRNWLVCLFVCLFPFPLHHCWRHRPHSSAVCSMAVLSSVRTRAQRWGHTSQTECQTKLLRLPKRSFRATQAQPQTPNSWKTRRHTLSHHSGMGEWRWHHCLNYLCALMERRMFISFTKNENNFFLLSLLPFSKNYSRTVK